MLELVALAVALGACGARPLPPPPIDEIPEGAGLLSGDDGEFVIFGR